MHSAKPPRRHPPRFAQSLDNWFSASPGNMHRSDPVPKQDTTEALMDEIVQELDETHLEPHPRSDKRLVSRESLAAAQKCSSNRDRWFGKEKADIQPGYGQKPSIWDQGPAHQGNSKSFFTADDPMGRPLLRNDRRLREEHRIDLYGVPLPDVRPCQLWQEGDNVQDDEWLADQDDRSERIRSSSYEQGRCVNSEQAAYTKEPRGRSIVGKDSHGSENRHHGRYASHDFDTSLSQVQSDYDDTSYQRRPHERHRPPSRNHAMEPQSTPKLNLNGDPIEIKMLEQEDLKSNRSSRSRPSPISPPVSAPQAQGYIVLTRLEHILRRRAAHLNDYIVSNFMWGYLPQHLLPLALSIVRDPRSDKVSVAIEMWQWERCIKPGLKRYLREIEFNEDTVDEFPEDDDKLVPFVEPQSNLLPVQKVVVDTKQSYARVFKEVKRCTRHVQGAKLCGLDVSEVFV